MTNVGYSPLRSPLRFRPTGIISTPRKGLPETKLFPSCFFFCFFLACQNNLRWSKTQLDHAATLIIVFRIFLINKLKNGFVDLPLEVPLNWMCLRASLWSFFFFLLLEFFRLSCDETLASLELGSSRFKSAWSKLNKSLIFCTVLFES